MLESIPLPSPDIDTVTGAASQDVDTLVLGLAEDAKLSPTLSEIDQSSSGWISRLLEAGQIRGKQGELTLLASPLTSGPTMLLLVGLGGAPRTRGLAFDAAASAIRKLSDRRRDRILVHAISTVLGVQRRDDRYNNNCSVSSSPACGFHAQM